MKILLTYLLAVFAFCAHGQLVINELMSLNQGTFTDEFDQRGDWVEIWNRGEVAIDLGGKWFTDDLTFPMKFQIPSDAPQQTTVAPGEFKIVWFDKQPGKGPLHVDLALNTVDGERVGLFHADGATLIDSLSFPALDADISYGRFVDGGEDVLEFRNPTPGASNTLSGPIHIGTIPNQFVAVSAPFTTIDLDEFISVLEYEPSEIDWQVSGQSELVVALDVVTHEVSVSYSAWQGSEDLVFRAEDPAGNVAQRSVRFSAGTVLPQPLDCATTLTTSGSPYLLKNNAFVPANCSLIIDAGVALHIGRFKEVVVKGLFEANGTASEPIDLLAHQGHWRALYLDSADGNAVLRHVLIEDGTFGNDSIRMNAVIAGRYSNFLVEDCVFQNNDRCIYAKHGNVAVRNNDFYLSNRGEKVNLQFSNALVEGNYLEFTAGDNDCIDMDGVDGAQVLDNVIIGGEDDGIDIGLIDGVGSSNVLVRGNTIQGIFDKGISIGEGSQNVTVERNVIFDCGNGVAVKDSSTAVVDHCTIAFTGIGVHAFEKDAGLGGGIVEVRNCVIDHSQELAVRADALSTMNVSYSLSGDQAMFGEQNIFADARFTDKHNMQASGFQLSALSPAIDAANPNNPTDPDGSRADMGAYPFDKSLAESSESIALFPNPATDRLSVILLSEQRSKTDLEIFDIMGHSVLSTQIPASTINVLGNIRFELDLVDLSAGQYLLQVKNDAASYTEKFLVIDQQ